MYSVGVLISLGDDPILEEFIFSHYSLIENKLHQLQAVASKILCSLLRKSPSYHSLYGVSVFLSNTEGWIFMMELPMDVRDK